MSFPRNFVLVRHGESEGNAAMRMAERGDPDALRKAFEGRHTSQFRLTDLGVEQAAAAGAWLRQEFFENGGGFDRCYTSQYVRAMETAALLELPNAEWYRNFYLAERDSGGIEQRPEHARDEEFRTMLGMRTIEPFFWRPSNGESIAQMCLRLDRVQDTLHRECSDGNVVAVCHGEVMWGFRVLVERLAQETFRDLYLSKDPANRIHNCQILHYTRADPDDPLAPSTPHVNWMRMVRPTTTPVWTTGWRKIERTRHSNEDLRRIVETHPRTLSSK
ncbi:MAG: phosphoglycerate mutase family protein [Patescibacteria group bacterium]|jgi:NAD+ kinase